MKVCPKYPQIFRPIGVSELLSFSVKTDTSQTCRPSQGSRVPDHAAEKWSEEIWQGKTEKLTEKFFGETWFSTLVCASIKVHQGASLSG